MIFYRTNVRGISRTVWGYHLGCLSHSYNPRDYRDLFLVPLWAFDGTHAVTKPGIYKENLTVCILKEGSFHRYLMDSSEVKGFIRRLDYNGIHFDSVVSKVGDFLMLLNASESVFNIKSTGKHLEKMFYRKFTEPEEVCKFLCNLIATDMFQNSPLHREMKHNPGAVEFIKEHTRGTGAYAFLSSITNSVPAPHPVTPKAQPMPSVPKPDTGEKFKFIAQKVSSVVVSAEFNDQPACKTAAAEFVTKGYTVELVKVLSRASSVTSVVWDK